MTDEQYTFEQTRVRLEGILVEVRKKDTSLEQSLELLEEGVRLLNQCNELIDQTAWRPAVEATDETAEDDAAVGVEGAEPSAAGDPEAVASADEPADEPHAATEEPAADEPEVAAEDAELEDDERD